MQICSDNLGLSKDIKKNEGFIAFFYNCSCITFYGLSAYIILHPVCGITFSLIIAIITWLGTSQHVNQTKRILNTESDCSYILHLINALIALSCLDVLI